MRPLTAQQDIHWSSGGIRYRANTVARSTGQNILLGALIGGAVFSTPALWVPYGRTTAALRISPVGGVNSNGDPRLGVRIASRAADPDGGRIR